MKDWKHMKHIMLFLLFAAFAVSVQTTSVHAGSPNYDILSVEIDDLLVFSSDANATIIKELDVERGETITIEVVIKGDKNITLVDDVNVEAKIIGYEFGRVSSRAGPFSVEKDKTYKKVVTLTIPEDIDASQDYSLVVEVSDALDEEEVRVKLFLDEPRHNLRLFDALLNPSSTIGAGNPVFVTARLENMGEKKEEDIKVKASIDALGISAVNYIDELVTRLQEEREKFKDREESSKQIDLLLRIPEDAKTGTYDLRVDVEYNRGHSFLSKVMKLNVKGVEKEKEVQTIINSDSTSKVTAAGKEVAYKIMIANLGKEPGIYSVQIDGVSTWGELSVDPGFVNVMPDSTGEAVVRITPFDTDKEESHTWVARVMLGTRVISELTFTTKVTPSKVVEPAVTGDAIKTVLAIIFGILVVVLVVLAIVIAFRKLSPAEREGEEPSTAAEGQTYYQYYPKK